MVNEIDKQFLDKCIANFKFLSQATDAFLGEISNLEHDLLFKSKLAEGVEHHAQELFAYLLEPEIILFRNKVIATRKAVKLICTRQFADENTKFFVNTYAPIINPETNNLVAIFETHNHIETFHLCDVFARLYTHGKAKLHKFDPTNIKLTNREHQVIFLFLLNLDSKSIA